MNGVSCGEEIMTRCSAVLIGCQRVTDRQTDVQPISITCFSIADARKNRRFSFLFSCKIQKKRLRCLSCVCILHFGRRFSKCSFGADKLIIWFHDHLPFMIIYCPTVSVMWRMLKLCENGSNRDYLSETSSVLRKATETEISGLTFSLRFGFLKVYRNWTEIRFPHIPKPQHMTKHNSHV